MAPRKNPENKPEAAQEPLSQAAEKASLVIRGLQSRLRSRSAESVEFEDTAEELERQLQQYFSTSVPAPRPGPLNDVRERVIDGVADRILRDWERNTTLQNEVVERLIDRVLERLGATA